MIELAPATTELVVGAVLRVAVRWAVDGRAPEALAVRLAWTTAGRGDRDRGVVDEARFDASTGGVPPSLEVDLRLPASGPISYDGKLLRVLWAVEAQLALPWARDEHASDPLRVLPIRVGAPAW